MKLRKLARLCEHDQLRSHEIHCGSSNCLIPQDHEWCPGGVFLPDDALTPAWIGDTSVDEVSDLVWDAHADVIDVSGMDPVWVLKRETP